MAESPPETITDIINGQYTNTKSKVLKNLLEKRKGMGLVFGSATALLDDWECISSPFWATIFSSVQ